MISIVGAVVAASGHDDADERTDGSCGKDDSQDETNL